MIWYCGVNPKPKIHINDCIHKSTHSRWYTSSKISISSQDDVIIQGLASCISWYYSRGGSTATSGYLSLQLTHTQAHLHTDHVLIHTYYGRAKTCFRVSCTYYVRFVKYITPKSPKISAAFISVHILAVKPSLRDSLFLQFNSLADIGLLFPLLPKKCTGFMKPFCNRTFHLWLHPSLSILIHDICPKNYFSIVLRQFYLALGERESRIILYLFSTTLPDLSDEMLPLPWTHDSKGRNDFF